MFKLQNNESGETSVKLTVQSIVTILTGVILLVSTFITLQLTTSAHSKEIDKLDSCKVESTKYRTDKEFHDLRDSVRFDEIKKDLKALKRKLKVDD